MLTIRQAAEELEQQHNVAEEVEERNGPFALILGVIKDLVALPVGAAKFLVADVAQVEQPVPDVAQAMGCGEHEVKTAQYRHLKSANKIYRDFFGGFRGFFGFPHPTIDTKVGLCGKVAI